MRLPSFLLCLFGLLLAAPLATAQSGDVRRVILIDGTVLVGTVADESADPLVVRTREGTEVRIPRDRVAEVLDLIAGRFTRTDPTRTRLVFSPTGRTIGQRGQTRLGVLAVLTPQVTYAVADRVDIGGSAIIAFGGGGGGVVVPGVKAQVVRAPGVDIAIGTALTVPFSTSTSFDGAYLLSPYVAATLGSEITSATVAVTGFIGGTASSGDFNIAEGVLLSLGGETQISDRIKLLGEVLVPVAEGASGTLFLPGIRFFGDRFSADVFGVVLISEGDVTGFAPIASFTYRF